MLDEFAGKTLLITGAGGSIGSALALRLAQLREPQMILLEASEDHLYRLQQAIAGTEGNAAAAFVLGNAGDRATLDEIFSAYKPRIVVHAAAHKHVPLLETQPLAAIANNVFATEAVVAKAAKHGARIVLLSTDKAVRPTSVMGATKRVAEEIVLASGGTVSRLANVLESSGSVTEIFRKQIAHGGPLTVTHPETRRYFLTMEEAVDLVFAAGYIAADSGSASLLGPALEADHSIVELAEFMARTLAPGRGIPIHFAGLRPGDKLFEWLRDDDEQVNFAKGGFLSIQSSRPAPSDFSDNLGGLGVALRERDLTATIEKLRAMVPGYSPSDTVLALAQKGSPRVYA